MGYVKIPAATNRTTEFTSSGTWVCPSGVYSAEFLVVGAGGGGGGAYCNLVTNAVGGGGGGGGAVKRVQLATTPGSSYTITVGAKGTGGTSNAGVSGGFSEVVLSGTTLIRSLGGAGGSGINTTPTIVQVTMNGLAGGGGYVTTANATDSSACTGGGGGASQIVPIPTLAYYENAGAEGGTGRLSSTSPNIDRNIVGGMGIDGFGAGGNGGNWHTSTATTFEPPYGAGAGGVRSAGATGAANGSNATIAGCGGGAGIAILSAATPSTGGNGADGIVRITYFG